MSHWYLIQIMIRQERCALKNLERQGFEYYLPKIQAEKIAPVFASAACRASVPPLTV